MRNFFFIENSILRANLDFTFDHIVDLTTLSESDQYQERQLLLSSLRKTIIIHIASIIEALLLWKLKIVCGAGKVEIPDEWRYKDIKILHTINDSEEVIAGIRKKEEVSLDRVDFAKIIILCEKHDIIGANKRTDIDRVRLFRNRLHLGGLLEMEKEYTKEDLEFSFKVANQVIRLVSP